MSRCPLHRGAWRAGGGGLIPTHDPATGALLGRVACSDRQKIKNTYLFCRFPPRRAIASLTGIGGRDSCLNLGRQWADISARPLIV
jgi:hypothetical protein